MKLKQNKASHNKNDILEKHIKRTYGDQKGQLDFLINNFFNYEKNGLPRNGFFIDLAAADGVKGSNTLFLEKYLNWDGILFEPNPRYEDSLKTNRKLPLIQKCVSDKINQNVKFRIDNGQLGGIVSDKTDNSFAIRGEELKNAEIIELKTTTLEKELNNFNAPKIIDFLSLDVEGSEYDVLKSFPFRKYKFKCITIERPKRKLDLLLDTEGYVQIKHMKFDVIYAHRDYFSQINFKPSVKFAFTPRKDW
tara:strand:- start:203 stop:949 length:747 start_codon:yes stop_codon:yes gene_type:complete